MPGPELRSPYTFDLPVVESGKVYQPGSIAREIRNLYVTSEDTLASVRGPVPYETGSQVSLGRLHGMLQVSTLDGANDVLVVRGGTYLYRHAGWSRTWDPIPAPSTSDCKNGTLNDDGRQPYPDAMVAINGLICWSNGIDRPRVIDAAHAYGSKMTFLGYDRAPGALTGFGPSAHMDTATSDDYPDTPPNWFGYSHQGRIGTIGDEMTGQDGTMQAGSWFYFQQLEDEYGNLSPLSQASNVVFVNTQSCSYDHPAASTTNYRRHNTTDDLTRQFLVKGSQSGGTHTVYTRIYRTPDTRHYPAEPRLLVRIPGRGPICFPDNIPDGLLLARAPALQLRTIPNFRVACEYQGRLVMANSSAAPGSVWVSEPGFPGTLLERNVVNPDPTGAEIGGVFSAAGALFALTSRSMFRISIGPYGLTADPVSHTVGCVAPHSIVGLPDGSVMWLGRGAFYRFDGESVGEVSGPIATLLGRVNANRAGRAVAVYNPDRGEYFCALPLDSQNLNEHILVYDVVQGGWREQRHGIYYRALCVTNDHRALVLAAGYNNATQANDIYVLDHESRTFTPPAKTFLFSSVEMRIDPLGRRRGNVPTIYFGFVESEIATAATLTWWRDGRSDNPVTDTFKLVDVDLGATESWGTAVLGTTTFRTPKLFWRKADVQINDVASFRFSLSIAEPAHLHLAGLVFDANLTDKGGSRVPGPR